LARPRIGQLLVQAGLLTPEELSEALTAQQIYGGRLGTILVEHDFVDEDDLAEVLAAQLGMPRVTREHLASIPAPVLTHVPKAVATRFRVVPFRYEDEKKLVSLAVPDPRDLQLQDELQFALGRHVELYICPEILLARALEKYYGVTRERRYIKLDVGGARRRPKRAGRATGQPLDAPTMLRLIVSAPDQAELLDRSLDCLASFASDVALLAVTGAELAFWSGRGRPVRPAPPTDATVRLASSATLGRALAVREPVVLATLDEAPLRALFAGRLRLDCTTPVMLAPLTVQDRAFGCYVLGSLGQDRTADPGLVGEVVRRVGWRLQALHLMECVAAPLPSGA
jgi:hypothetical protein